MSVVATRHKRLLIDTDIQTGVTDWRKRWFVKPGLMGLTQGNNLTDANSDENYATTSRTPSLDSSRTTSNSG